MKRSLTLATLGMVSLLGLGYSSGCAIDGAESAPLESAPLEPAPLEEASQAEARLEVKIDTARWSAEQEVDFTFTNPNRSSVWVLRRQLPSQDARADLLAVSRDGAPVRYEGVLALFLPPAPEDYLEIGAGESYTVAVDPTALYDMEEPGTYYIDLRLTQLGATLEAPQAMAPQVMASAGGERAEALPTHRLQVASQAPAQVLLAHGSAGKSGRKKASSGIPQDAIGGYTNCSASQKTALAAAHKEAMNIARTALWYLSYADNSFVPDEYWTYFGYWGPIRYGKVKQSFQKIYEAFANQSVKYSCGGSLCTGMVAYVLSGVPYEIYTCDPAFFNLPTSPAGASPNVFTKGGTLVHEMSHFYVVADTSDWAYAKDVLTLAGQDPEKAINNADSYRQFGEAVHPLSAALKFRDTSTERVSTADWDGNHGKATCANGEAIVGLSQVPGDHQGRSALCRGADNTRFPGKTVTAALFLPGDKRRAQRLSDWSPGHYKLECGAGEYVRAVSENVSYISGNNAFHGVQCVKGSWSGLGSSCNVRVFDGAESRGDPYLSAGDWDVGAYKGECNLGEYVAGVSVNPVDFHPHAILCCS